MTTIQREGKGVQVLKVSATELTAVATLEKRADEVSELERYLEETDYVVIKMYEASLEGQDLAPFKEKYAEILKKRAEAREKVNTYKERK